jgi:hypothetical protein
MEGRRERRKEGKGYEKRKGGRLPVPATMSLVVSSGGSTPGC